MGTAVSACEQCWADAYLIARMSGRHQAKVYRELLETRTHEPDAEAPVGEER